MSIPLGLLLGAGGFVVFARFAEVQGDVPAVLLGLYLATWSFIFAVGGVTLFFAWRLWKWHHTRTAHALRPC